MYEAEEAAGLTVEGLRASYTGVYVRLMSGDIEASLLRGTQNTPVSRSIIPNHISYLFGGQGPSITVDTACSSSLVAVHMVVQCGTNLLLRPGQYIVMSKLKMLSPDPLSRMWDRGDNGYARGDEDSVIVLETLSKVLANGDDIECIIRETRAN